MGLYKEIKKELEEQGHIVTYIEEPQFAVSVYSRQLSLVRVIKKYYVEKTRYFEKYWKKRIKEERIFNEKYDVFFCVNGKSFHPILINHLKINNPCIKTSLYIWDSNKTFDYFRNVQYFDKVYSFDLFDVKNCGSENVEFLPFYWPKNLEKFDGAPIKYSVFSVGSLHDDRLYVYKKVTEQLNKEGIPFFIKLVVRPISYNLKNKIKVLLLKFYREEKKLDNILVLTGRKSYPFVTDKYIEPKEMTHLVSQSKAVLDTDIEIQGGVTPRLVWALASNKRVFTTNKNIINFPFFNPQMVHVIDRDKPMIDVAQLLQPLCNTRTSVIHLRIDNWIKYFI